MTGFSAQWLAMREPVDHRSRDVSLQNKVSSHFEQRRFSAAQPMRIMDLGCGTGSNLRALADELPDHQHWTLIDYDLELLQAAKAELTRWSNAETTDGLSPLNILHQTKHIKIEFLQEDLAVNIERVLETDCDLVTAAAFFDLVSESWLDRFCASLRNPFYTVLTYNGDEQWFPSDDTDSEILQAFHHHQQQDKGLGIAAGPDATRILVEQLQSRSFDTYTASSPWVLAPPADQMLIEALARGSAAAVQETALVAPDRIQSWLNRGLGASQCVVGHWDLWSIPVEKKGRV